VKSKLSVISALLLTSPLLAGEVPAEISAVESALSAARAACGGISGEISKISRISIANTATTAVGTAASGGALAAGIKKSEEDLEIERLEKLICERGGCSPENVEAMSDADFFNNILQPMAEIAELQERIEKSKKLGNWRTGLLAGGTAASIGSSIMAGLNTNQSELAQQTSTCNQIIALLGRNLSELKAAGISPMKNPLLIQISKVVDNCQPINADEIEKIETRMKAVMGTSIAGAAVGAVGIGTSAAANTDKVRNDNSDAGKKKEKKLNTTANVMAGLGAGAGLIGTGFNISLITLTNKLIKRAERCEDALK
jgi:hypothetical protein